MYACMSLFLFLSLLLSLSLSVSLSLCVCVKLFLCKKVYLSATSCIVVIISFNILYVFSKREKRKEN